MSKLMRTTIQENQIGLLYQNGRLKKWLEPGRYGFWTIWGEVRIQVLELDEPVAVYRPELERVAPPDTWSLLEVGAHELAIVSVDGLAKAYLRPGRYMLWQLRHKVEAQLFDLSVLQPEIPERLWSLVPEDLAQVLTVASYERILVYDGGALTTVLQERRALISKLNREIRIVRVDTRERERVITGQEVMTSDKVSLRLNFILKYKINDAVLSVERVMGLEDAMYSEAQMAVRRAVSGVKLDVLLEERRKVSETMTAEVGLRAEAWGVEVTTVDIKDVVLPGEMKALLNRVIEAEKQAAAQVILRREETAATRSQANTAKVLEANPVLLRLKELETLKEVASSLDQVTLVAGVDGLRNTIFGGGSTKT